MLLLILDAPCLEFAPDKHYTVELALQCHCCLKACIRQLSLVSFHTYCTLRAHLKIWDLSHRHDLELAIGPGQ